mgnify:CR=1 FL=1
MGAVAAMVGTSQRHIRPVFSAVIFATLVCLVAEGFSEIGGKHSNTHNDKYPSTLPPEDNEPFIHQGARTIVAGDISTAD